MYFLSFPFSLLLVGVNSVAIACEDLIQFFSLSTMDLQQILFSSNHSLITECIIFDETPILFFDNHEVYRILGNDKQLIKSFTSLNLIIDHCLILPHCILLFSECSSVYYFPHTAITSFTSSHLALSSTSGHSFLLPVYSSSLSPCMLVVVAGHGMNSSLSTLSYGLKMKINHCYSLSLPSSSSSSSDYHFYEIKDRSLPLLLVSLNDKSVFYQYSSENNSFQVYENSSYSQEPTLFASSSQSFSIQITSHSIIVNGTSLSLQSNTEFYQAFSYQNLFFTISKENELTIWTLQQQPSFSYQTTTFTCPSSIQFITLSSSYLILASSNHLYALQYTNPSSSFISIDLPSNIISIASFPSSSYCYVSTASNEILLFSIHSQSFHHIQTCHLDSSPVYFSFCQLYHHSLIFCSSSSSLFYLSSTSPFSFIPCTFPSPFNSPLIFFTSPSLHSILTYHSSSLLSFSFPSLSSPFSSTILMQEYSIHSLIPLQHQQVLITQYDKIQSSYSILHVIRGIDSPSSGYQSLQSLLQNWIVTSGTDYKFIITDCSTHGDLNLAHTISSNQFIFVGVSSHDHSQFKILCICHQLPIPSNSISFNSLIILQ